MLRNNLRLLLTGFSESDAAILSAAFAKLNVKINYRAIADLQDIRAAFYESDWHVLVCNHAEHSLNFIDVHEIWKQVGRDIPFIIYSDEMDDEKALSAIHHGVHDCVNRGHVARLMLAIERELKDVETRRAKLQAESKIYRLAYYDDLTGFPKRNLFCEKVSGLLSKQSEIDALAAVYFVKIGHLPYINSTYGYSVGDMLIQQLSYRLSVYTNSKCLLSRIESSKFAFFNCEVNNLEDMQKFADRIMRMASTPIIINNLEFYVTLNIGVSVYPTHGSNISMLLANAESTLSDSQDKWRNSCRYFMSEVGETSAKRFKLGEALQKAIPNNELMLVYQPLVDLKSGDLTGTEALLRWNHPELGVLSPKKFISIAYENGLIIDIGKWILKQACIDVESWRAVGHEALSISISISAIELDQNQFIRCVKDVLAETGFPPDLLVFEIAESFLQGTEASLANLRELGDMGVRFSVAGYGTHGSSIKCLKKLPVSSLKIDDSLTSDISLDSENIVIIKAINALAKSLGLSVIAGNVKTKKQLEFLYETQCDYAQGDIFTIPVNNKDFLKLLEQRKTGTLA